MATPKTIKIFLVGGEPDGLRTVDLSGWSGKSIIIPRNKLKDVKDRPDCNKPSVYFLVGKEDEETPTAYIGETESLWRRLYLHAQSKEFWMTAIAFFSKDETLTKAYVKYLESRCIQIAERAGRFRLLNTGGSSLPSLPEATVAEVEEFLEYLRLLLTAAGYPILQEVVPREQADTSDPLLICRGNKGAEAQGRAVSEGFVVYKDSTAAAHVGPTQKDLRKRLDKLEANGVLRRKDDALYVFVKDHVFNSPSGAACAVLGRHATGPKEWKTKDGKSYAEIYGQNQTDLSSDS